MKDCVGVTHEFNNLTPQSTIMDLKRLVKKRTCICEEQQRIIFSGKEREDGYTLFYRGVENGALLYLVPRLRGC